MRLISQQPRFTQPTSKRFRPLLFARGEDFREALDLYRLRSMAWGQGWDVYESWLHRYEQAQQAAPEEIEQERKQGRRRPRRRRRSARPASDGAVAS